MRDNHFDPATELVIAGIDTDDGPSHPCFDGESNAEPVDDGMVRFMTNYGWFGSVVVTSLGGKRYVVAGRRRVRAAREANRRISDAGGTPFKVAVEHYRPDNKNRDAGLIAVVVAENALRRKERTEVSLARQAARLMNAGTLLGAVATTFGVTESGVRRWLKIGELAPVVQAAIEARRITSEAGLLLHGKPEPEQAALLDKMLSADTSADASATADAPETAAAETKAVTPAKRRARRAVATAQPKRVGKDAALERVPELAGGGEGAAPARSNGARRSPKVVRKIMELPRFSGSEEFRRGALWAIGDLSDVDAAVFEK